MAQASGPFVGIDVSKETLEVVIGSEGELWSVPYNRRGLRKMIRRLRAAKPALVVMEATGGYERKVLEGLGAEGLPVARVNPRRVRSFARATGLLAKADHLDARVLARFGEAVKPRPYIPPPKEQQVLQSLVRRREQLLKMRTAEISRLDTAPDCIREQIKEHIRWLGGEIERIEKEIDGWIDRIPEWKGKVEIAETFQGVGRVTAVTLIAEVPELGQVNRKEIASLTGYAPMNNESGRRRGKRRIKGGRPRIRSVLYMATLAAIRHNPVIRRRYHELLARGKEKKVALIACARYLLVILNAMIRDHQPWNPSLCAT